MKKLPKVAAKSHFSRCSLNRGSPYLTFGGKGQLFGFAYQTTAAASLVSTVKVELGGRKKGGCGCRKKLEAIRHFCTEREMFFKPHYLEEWDGLAIVT